MRTRRSELATTNDDGSLTVVAATAEQALQDVSELLGPDAQIVKADKLTRGGVGGFFAQEVVQLTARRGETNVAPSNFEGTREAAPTGIREAAAVVPVGGERSVEPSALRGPIAEGAMRASFTEMLERMVATSDGIVAEPPEPSAHTVTYGPTGEVAAGAAASIEEERKERVIKEAFARFQEPGPLLTAEHPALATEVVTTPESISAPLEAPVEEMSPPPGSAAAAEEPHPPGTGRVDWSQDELIHLGVPFALISPTIGLDPDDDLAWVNAIAGALVDSCGPLPDGPTVLVGPEAHSLAETLGHPEVHYPVPVPREGSVCMTLPGDSTSRTWLIENRNDRRLHLVIGSSDSNNLLDLEPETVSWIGEEALITALWLCATRGVRLGYGRSSDGKILRARPTDVALAIRDRVGRR